MNIEGYIKDLDPELQERARACGSVEELLALAKEAKVPLPDGALAAIAGGADQEDGNCDPSLPKCPKCGSKNVRTYYLIEFICEDCGYTWKA